MSSIYKELNMLHVHLVFSELRGGEVIVHLVFSELRGGEVIVHLVFSESSPPFNSLNTK
jgi:deoxycytidine triphosphate deaminase